MSLLHLRHSLAAPPATRPDEGDPACCGGASTIMSRAFRDFGGAQTTRRSYTALMRATIIGTGLVLLAAAACSGTRKAVAVPPEQFGIYRFSERLNPGNTLEGEFLVQGDTVTVDAVPGPCRYEPNRTSGMAIVYSCGSSVTLSFDRADPIRKARYSAVVRMTESRTRCIRTTVSNGQSVCAQSVVETSERDALKSGTLRVERVEPAIGTPIPPATSPATPPG